MWHLYLLFKLLYSLYPDSCSNFVLRWTPWGLGFSRCRVPACEKILQGSCSVAEHPQKIPRFWIKVSFEGACIRKWQWCHEMSVPSTTHWALSMYSINWQHFSSYFLHLLLVFQNISMLSSLQWNLKGSPWRACHRVVPSVGLPTLPFRTFPLVDPEYLVDENTALRTALAFCIEKLLWSTLTRDFFQIQKIANQSWVGFFWEGIFQMDLRPFQGIAFFWFLEWLQASPQWPQRQERVLHS